jgi:hypothetical protein
MSRNITDSRKALKVAAFLMVVVAVMVLTVQGFSTGRYDRAQTGCECHGSTADPTVTVDITGQPAEYSPLQIYELTVTVSGGPATTKGGFNLEASAGTLTSDDPNVQTNGPQSQATHTNPNQRTWNVNWTAPSAGTGAVTLWVAGNAVNGNGNNGGDGWNLNSFVVPEAPKPQNDITLKEGWNLISVNLIPSDTNPGAVLSSISGSYNAVQWYDSADSNDPWKHNRTGKLFGNDLTEINETMGFWIQVTQPGDTIFTSSGTEPVQNQSIALHPGWNLVGYPSLSDKTRDVALNNVIFDTDVDSIQAFNATTGAWENVGASDYFKVGRGYWIHSIVETAWEVPL